MANVTKVLKSIGKFCENDQTLPILTVFLKGSINDMDRLYWHPILKKGNFYIQMPTLLYNVNNVPRYLVYTDLRGSSLGSIGGIQYFREIIKCKKRSFRNSEIST